MLYVNNDNMWNYWKKNKYKYSGAVHNAAVLNTFHP